MNGRMISVLQRPDAEYWSWLLNMAAPLKDFVPIKATVVDEIRDAVWNEGAYLMQLVPFAANQALRTTTLINEWKKKIPLIAAAVRCRISPFASSS